MRERRKRKLNEHVQNFLKCGGKRKKAKPVEKNTTKHYLTRKRLFSPKSPTKSMELTRSIEEKPTKTTKQISRQKIQGKRIARRNQARVYRVNKALRQENANLKKLAEMYKKRYYRLLKKVKENKDTSSPRSMVNSMIAGRSIPQDVQDKLLEHAVLEKQLEDTWKNKTSYKDKDVLKRVLGGKIIRKYRKITYLRKFAPKRCMTQSLDPNVRKSLAYRSFSHKSTMPTLAADVQSFLERDCNSRMTSGVHETKTCKGIKMQRRYLLKTMAECHMEFLRTMPYSLSYSKFCSLRPFYIMFPQVSSHQDIF
jgi:hypothetical protein